MKLTPGYGVSELMKINQINSLSAMLVDCRVGSIESSLSGLSRTGSAGRVSLLGRIAICTLAFIIQSLSCLSDG